MATPAATVPTPTSATSFTLIARHRVGAAQVEDQLLEVLDRVDVVVRRRRDQAHARRGVADLADVLVHLVAGQLAALAGLRALGHLDLELVGVDEVVRGDAEAAGGHLLDRRAARVAVRRPACSGAGPPRPRPCSTCRRGGSSRWRASRAPPVEIEPSDIAPVEKRLTISLASSTSSIGIGSAVESLNSSRPRSVARRFDSSLTARVNSS